MKKFLFFPCTILRPFLVSLPLVLIMAAAIRLNDAVDTPLKLYPLIIFLGGAIIFTFVYFFRAIILTKDEVKYIGLFSSRDRAVINEGKTLIITLKPKHRMKVDLYGNDGVNAELDWLKDENVVRDTYLFRGSAIGGTSEIDRIFDLFDVPMVGSMLQPLEGTTLDYEDYTVTTSETDGNLEVRIKFKRTI